MHRRDLLKDYGGNAKLRLESGQDSLMPLVSSPNPNPNPNSGPIIESRCSGVLQEVEFLTVGDNVETGNLKSGD